MRRAALAEAPLVALLLAACGGSGAQTSSPSIAAPPAVIILPQASGAVPVAMAEDPPPLPARPLEWAIWGDTPTIAWSPDGARLAIANQVNYLGRNDPEKSGIDVVDVRTGDRHRVHQGPGYHPVWLSDDRLAFGCSPYECDGAEGLYLLDIGGTARRVASRGVYHTRASRDGNVLFFSGFPEDEGWMIWDFGSQKPRPLASQKDSWHAPVEVLADQCPSRVEGRAVRVRGSEVVLRDMDGGDLPPLVRVDPWKLAWPEDRGLIQPCFSPDGRHVVYFSQRKGEGFVGVLPVGR